MKKLADILSEELKIAFGKAGYDAGYAVARVSDRPDLCEYQCNGALAAAKEYRKAPMSIAEEVVSFIGETNRVMTAKAVRPGFINISTREEFLAGYLNGMVSEPKLGIEEPEVRKTIIIDYGGANVAKPLHVGHLRSAVIGESIKRIARYVGHNVTGDVHLGDWGLQMGLIITELKRRSPDLPYFDEGFEGEYPATAPFTVNELEEIYPAASARAKEDPEYKCDALYSTYLLQNGHRGYTALWKHIINVSVEDLKKNYAALNVEFDLWKGESDAQPYIPGMVKYLKERGYARTDMGALVVDVSEETDERPIPPCMILKSDGAALYSTTDLATLIERERHYRPDRIIYVTDKRQEMHFTQVFRCAKKTGIVRGETDLKHVGFGTVNGADGKPFRTRDGGVMRLEYLIDDINEKMYEKIAENHTLEGAEARETARKVGLAALKYGDLSNQASKDYVFDTERFLSYDGNTGPYILYTVVRIKSILSKYAEETGGGAETSGIGKPGSPVEKNMMLNVARFGTVMSEAYDELAPHRICAYIYELSNGFNRFYRETGILSEENCQRRKELVALISLVKRVLETCIDVLGFEAPERM